MLKWAKVTNEETKLCMVGEGTDSEYYKSIGMSETDVEQAYNGAWYLKGYAPIESIEHKNESVRQQRQLRFASEADPIKYDYEEALALGTPEAEELKQTWLAKKAQIREELPYIEG